MPKILVDPGRNLGEPIDNAKTALKNVKLTTGKGGCK